MNDASSLKCIPKNNMHHRTSKIFQNFRSAKNILHEINFMFIFRDACTGYYLSWTNEHMFAWLKKFRTEK